MGDAPPTIGPGREVGPFRVVRAIGRGGMGVVWLARDQRLGRRVALKLIDPERLMAPGARERFQREAAATAALAHPNVVTLFEVGEIDGTPWVALEYIEGDTLRERIVDDPPPLRDALAIGRAIAGALAAAHAAGILHRDLKPANVILGRDGRARVVDFGLARRFGDTTPDIAPDLRVPDGAPIFNLADHAPPGGMPEVPARAPAESDAAGTPRYMAPEQWRREEPTPASDVWSLGLVLHELVWGHHPYEGLDRMGLRVEVSSLAPLPAPRTTRAVPPALADLVAECLAKRPEQRPSAAAIETQIGKMLERSAALDETDSPFRGLAPFAEKHAAVFYGRDGEVAAFLERVREQALLPVVGPSGAGKSSFVHAGVVPRLRERGWTVVGVRPGRHPLVALARRLRSDDTSTGSAPGPSASAPWTTATVTGDGITARERIPAPSRPDGDELAALLRDRPGRLGVELRDIAESHRTRLVLVVDQLEELHAGGVEDDERRAFLRALAAAAEDPAEPVRVIVTVRDDFLGKVAEVDEIRSALSRVTLLRSPGAEALREILVRPAESAGYRWDDGLVDDMVAAVATSPAGLPLLAFTARQMWGRRDRDNRRLTRATYDELGGVAGALAAHADGVIAGLTSGDEAIVRELLLRLVSPSRTRRIVSRAEVVAGLPRVADELLQRLVDARLVITRRAPGGGAELELAHDSLITAWNRLAHWIEEGHDDRAFVEHALQTATLWHDRGQRDDELWQGEALTDARRILGRQRAVPAPVEALLTASEGLARRRRWRRRGALAALVGSLAIIAIVASLAAVRIAREERHARHRAALAQVEAAAAALTGGDLLAARAHVRGALEVEDSLRARALWQRLASEPLVWTATTRGAVYALAPSPDGERIAAVGQDGAVLLVDRTTGAIEELAGGADQMFAAAWSHDGTRVATGAWDGQIRVWKLADRTQVAWAGHRGIVEDLAFVGDELWSIGSDGDLRSWDPRSGAAHARWRDGDAPLSGLAVTGDGAIVTTSWDGGVRRWSDGVATIIGRHEGGATAVAVAGDRIVTGGRDRTVRVWSGDGERRLARLEGEVHDLAYDPATDHVVVGTTRGRIHSFDLTTGRDELGMIGHQGDVAAVIVAGGVLFSGGADDAVRAWDLSVHPRRPDPGHSMTVVGVDVTADGTTAVSAGYDQEARRWDVATGRTTAVLRGHRGRIWAARFLPDGRIVTGSADGTVRLWDGDAVVAVAPLTLTSGQVYDVAVARDGSTIAAGATDGRVYLWQPANGAMRAIDVVAGGTVDGVALSPDGTRVAAGASDAVIRIYDVATGTLVRELRGHEGVVPGVAFSPDGTSLASCGEDGAVWLWDLSTGTGSILWRGARSYRVVFHPDGKLIGVASADNIARLLDRSGGPPRLLRGHRGEVNELRFSGDGSLAVTGSNDATVRAWDVATGAPRWISRTPADKRTPSLPTGLDDIPPSPLTTRSGGVGGMVALGFASGEVGLWDLATGLRLDTLRVHGPVVALDLTADRLHATSELGDETEIDLTPLRAPYCTLLRDVWSRVPVMSQGARPVRTPPPRSHRCR